MTTREGLMAAILAAPEDDLPRLVFADWLEENGEADRAEFIRVQCQEGYVPDWAEGQPRTPAENGAFLTTREQQLHRGLLSGCRLVGWDKGRVCYTKVENWPTVHRIDVMFARGLAEVACSLADWCGGPCGHCRGQGRLWNGGWGNRTTQIVQPEEMIDCPRCLGEARNHGIGPAVVRSHPVTRVVLNGVVRPVEADPAFGMVYRQEIGPLWPFLCNHPRYSGNLISLGVAVTDVIEKLESAVSDCVIQWAKSVTPGERGVQQRTEELA